MRKKDMFEKLVTLRNLNAQGAIEDITMQGVLKTSIEDGSVKLLKADEFPTDFGGNAEKGVVGVNLLEFAQKFGLIKVGRASNGASHAKNGKSMASLIKEQHPELSGVLDSIDAATKAIDGIEVTRTNDDGTTTVHKVGFQPFYRDLNNQKKKEKETAPTDEAVTV